ncbi:DegT/DnrJ/EryC1/StrS family aminotransferase [Hymenobacter sp. M29]|uniref:DegT/DnrJ/EryC1/StrS family aminotransferase n=1 Tax=Hymenobacter mellowenesis TaxID=3063995 RepID=A0ABT9ABJ8_9BACT|nr:DegT/DnrJ/EryC1/StrS family aminotransferase [Hymenobacter sp. M29]MDO7847216.1 DegT/DnrJ/EryC1/StrS family aminotransferase [Hymenobacter sp. M29]
MILPAPPTPVLLLDLAAEHAALQPALNDAMQEVMDAATFIQGPAVGQFAAELGEYLGGAHVVPCANGTDALTLALMSLELPAGAEVIVPAFTYVATLEAAALLGLRPVLVDVLSDTFNIDPAAAEAAITPRTGAIVAVHLFGQCADLEALRAISARHGVALIEDNAQAIGATFQMQNGETAMAGTVGAVGTTSFFPSKNLGCLGDGGALLTRDSARAALLHQLANHGQSRKYYHQRIGLNSRLDTLQAALLRVKLQQLPHNTAARQAVAARYDAALADVAGVIIPARDSRSTHVFHQYTIQVTDTRRRNDLQHFLKSCGVPTMIYYPLPVHAQPAYAYLGYRAGQFPVAERLCGAVLSLPIHPLLTVEQQEYIIDCVKSFMG